MTNSWLWVICSVVIFSAAALNYWELWKARKGVVDSAERFSFSPFTQAVVGTFSVLLGLDALSRAVEETFADGLILYGFVLFLALAVFGMIADFRKRLRKEEQR